MKIRPILFSGPMVRAILAGRKTQTRRVMKPQPLTPNGKWIKSPHGQPGDRLWVRELWRTPMGWDSITPRNMPTELLVPVWYEANHSWSTTDYEEPFEKGKCRPGIFMPRWASRITLEIASVRVERVQEISEDDAEAEGAMEWWNEQERIYSGGCGPCGAFRDLWTSINGGESWAANPWVWVIEFERIES